MAIMYGYVSVPVLKLQTLRSAATFYSKTEDVKVVSINRYRYRVPVFTAVFQNRDVLICIRVLLLPSNCQQKELFLIGPSTVLTVPVCCTFTSAFTDNKIFRRYNTVEIKGFLYFFCFVFRRIRIRTNTSGSGTPENLRVLRIRARNINLQETKYKPNIYLRKARKNVPMV
jgi:hypothetical protein